MNKTIMPILKTFAVCCLITVFAGCKETTPPPTAVLDSMFNAMKNGRLEVMKNYITQSDIALLEAAENFMNSVDPEGMKKIKARMTDELKTQAKDIQYRFKKEHVDGDHATVEAEITEYITTGQAGGKTTTHTFELVKENNAWKIALSKPGNEMFNSMKGNMGAKNRDLKDGLEKLKKMDPDSLKMLINRGLQALDSLEKKKKSQ